MTRTSSTRIPTVALGLGALLLAVGPIAMASSENHTPSPTPADRPAAEVGGIGPDQATGNQQDPSGYGFSSTEAWGAAALVAIVVAGVALAQIRRTRTRNAANGAPTRPLQATADGHVFCDGCGGRLGKSPACLSCGRRREA